jgi:hypothetical protein
VGLLATWFLVISKVAARLSEYADGYASDDLLAQLHYG